MAQKKSNKNQEAGEVVDIVEVKANNSFSFEDFIAENQKLLSYVIGGLALVAALYFGYKYLFIAPKQKEAVVAMYKAEALFAQDSFATALENTDPNVEGFLDIINNYGGTKAANLSKYYAGICYLNLGKYSEAIDYLNQYSAPDDITAVMKTGALGDAFAENGEKDKALTYYKQAATKIDNELTTPHYLNKLGLLYYSEGKTKEASEQFEKIVNNYPNSAENRDAEKLLARIQ